MNTELKHDIYIDWELAGTNPYKPLLTRVITAALAAENVTIPCSVDVLLTTDEGIREINQEQRNIDQATDVLSFPMLELTPGTPPDGTGEDEQDPIFCVTDLLPHLATEQSKRTLAEGVKGEELNIIIGVANCDFENAVKAIYDIFVLTQI